jgi:short-subunit dehydrogenase
MALPPPSESSTAVVTGASSGIGVEIARELAKRGQNLTLVARREERLRELAEELGRDHGVRAEVIAADIAGEEGRSQLADELRSRGRDVEVLINNAGFGSAGRFQKLDAEKEALMVRTNCEAVVALCGEYVPKMVNRGRGAILNLASIASFQPLPYQATYAATKAFVLSFSEGLSGDLHGTGVTVTALCPGPAPTEFEETAGIEGGEWQGIPKFVLTNPDYIAATGVEALEKGRRVVVPGPLNVVTAAAGHYTPRSVVVGLVRRFYPVGK